MISIKPIAAYDNIKNIARSAGISINEIEKKTGLSIGSICKWNTVSPTASSLLKVSKVLGCSINVLLGETDKARNLNIGTNIRRIREEKGISRTQLAQQVQISQSMLCQIERGTKVPSLPAAERRDRRRSRM